MRRAMLGVVAGLALDSAAACASSSPPRSLARPVPGAPPRDLLAAEVAVPAGQELIARAQAEGVQIYSCAVGPGGGAAWAFEAPEAALADEAGSAGKHFAGPTWEWRDGSRVQGEVVRKAPAGAADIPWLLLRAKVASGEGVLARATWIQRVDTAGGAPPPGGCDGAHAGAEARVPYRASYLFYGRR